MTLPSYMATEPLFGEYIRLMLPDIKNPGVFRRYPFPSGRGGSRGKEFA